MKKYIMICGALCLIIAHTTFAQTTTYQLDYTFGEEGVLMFPNNYLSSIEVQSDGKILVSTDQLFRLNTDGTPDLTFGTDGAISPPLCVTECVVMPDDQHIVMLHCNTSSPNQNSMKVYDRNGNFVSEFNILYSSSFPYFSDVTAVSDTVIRISYCGLEDIHEYDILNHTSNVLDSGIPDATRCIKLDSENGDMITSHLNTVLGSPGMSTFSIAKSGDPSFGDNGIYSRVFPFDGLGYASQGIKRQSDGKIIHVYSVTVNNPYHVATYIERLNADGTIDNTFNNVVIPDFRAHYGKHSITINSYDEIILTGLENSLIVMKVISPDGSYINNVHIPLLNGFEPGSIHIDAEDNIIMNCISSNASMIAKFERKIYSNFITGNVFQDDNSDCIKGGDESNLENWFVKIQGDYTTYTRTDTNGNYNIAVDTGSYTMSTLLPNDLWTGTCPADTIVEVIVDNTNTTVDLGVNHVGLCPVMDVDITTLSVPRCRNTYYFVKYCNDGTGEAEDAYVEVQLDPYFTFLNSSLSGTDLGDNLYSFDLGNVEDGDCSSFTILVNVDCDSTVLGQIHCVEAHIFPDSTCVPQDTLWDQASIVVNAQCTADSIEFTIENIGSGDMSDSLEYMVIEEDLIWHRANFQLDSGDNLKFSKPANGEYHRLESQQSPGHPGNSMPSVFVEGCGVDGSGEFSAGFVNDYPLDESSPFISIDCRANISSYDPNDKQAFPIGYGDQNYITESTNLEYMIRFQNTGTDTARNVVIRDIISPHLNIETLSPGVSSHLYRYDIEGSNIAIFTFDNIMLPDSNVNEAASHGFIKFDIEQQSNNPIGTNIMNDAAIYFDFNEPIITNTVFHTIGENFVGTIASVITPPEVVELGIAVNIFPNPFDEYTTFEVQGGAVSKLYLSVYDIMGREVVQQQNANQSFIALHRNNLPPGVYVFRLMDEKQQLATGKLVIE